MNENDSQLAWYRIVSASHQAMDRTALSSPHSVRATSMVDAAAGAMAIDGPTEVATYWLVYGARLERFA